MDQCPPHQTSINGKCACVNGFTLTTNGTECGCTEYLTDDDHCVSKCPAWYWTVQDNRCVEESWRLITAIAVPVGVVLVAACVGIVLFLLSRKNKNQVVNPESLSYI